MGQFSAFAPFGLFDFSDDPSPAELYYNAMSEQLSPAFDLSVGTYEEAKMYARAILFGCAREQNRAANNQRVPSKVHDKLPTWEKDYGIIVEPTWSPDTRREVLTARVMLMHGPREEALWTELYALLGSSLYLIRATHPSERLIWPDPDPTGIGTFPVADAPLVFGRILDPVVVPGVSQTVHFVTVGDVQPTVGQKLCFEPEVNVLTEAAVVTALGSDLSVGSPAISIINLLTATFAKAKDANSWFASAMPLWSSSQRILQVIVKPAAAEDPETRRKIHEVMARHCKTTTEWEILESSDGVHVGPWTVNVGVVGATAIGDAPMTFTLPYGSDPGNFALTGWYKTVYAGPPWNGSYSRGTSGGRTVQTDAADPGIGSVNGLALPTFNGAQRLKDAVTTMGSYIGTAVPYRFVALIFVGANAAPSAQPYTDPGIWVSTGGWVGISINSTNVQIFQYDSGGTVRTATKAITPGWHMIDASWNGSTLSIAVDGGTPGTAACASANAAIPAQTVFVGTNYNNIAYFVGSIAEVFMGTTLLPTMRADYLKLYFNNRYNLSL